MDLCMSCVTYDGDVVCVFYEQGHFNRPLMLANQREMAAWCRTWIANLSSDKRVQHLKYMLDNCLTRGERDELLVHYQQ